MRILIDGVFFQLNNTGIARVWESVIRILAAQGQYEIYFLDRGRAPKIENISYIPFPTFWGKDAPADSFLIQDVCDQLDIDVFTSSYYTTPISTPMVLMVYDMIPEIFDFDMSHRIWMEKQTAINYAQRYLCISESTRKDLLKFYPEIPPGHVSMAHCGVDSKVFCIRPTNEINYFKKKHGLIRPYFLFVGSRVQHNGYKNSELFFNALPEVKKTDFDIFCVGGEPEIEPQILAKIPSGVHCKRVTLTDSELSLAYGGAISLIYPSLYEGFGMPVIEAMASGCPVITTSRGSLAEAAGNAAYLIDGTSIKEMAIALDRIQSPELQQVLREKGILHAKDFRWEDMANTLSRCFDRVKKEAKAGQYDEFFYGWKKLRKMQANVDYERP